MNSSAIDYIGSPRTGLSAEGTWQLVAQNCLAELAAARSTMHIGSAGLGIGIGVLATLVTMAVVRRWRARPA